MKGIWNYELRNLAQESPQLDRGLQIRSPKAKIYK